jgi:hypothetical protein
MKFLIFFLLILLALWLLTSCSKEKLPEAISFTQTRTMYDSKGRFEGIHLVYHLHRVTDPARIKEYRALPGLHPYCDDMNDTLVTVIERPCEGDCKK